MNAKLILSSFLLLLGTTNTVLQAQKTEKSSPPQYLRLDIQNDMLVPLEKTDRYFSSGLKLDYFFMKNPDAKFPLGKIFPRTKKGDLYMGLTVSSNMYTPADKSEVLEPGDRPYAGWLYLGAIGVSNDIKNETRYTTEYSLGVIGPAAMQEAMQRRMHKLISRPMPKGWDKYQIANDIAINLSFTGEKRFAKPSDNLELFGLIETNVGTVTNYMGIGGMMRIGWFDDYFKNIVPLKDKGWQLFVFARPVVRVVMDNALLQGGFFNYNKSPYTVSKDDLNRVYFDTEFGYGVSFRKFNITYSQNIRTPEFRGAENMHWGALTVTTAL